MPVPADTLRHASQHRAPAVESVLEFYLPVVRRVATALAGEIAAGKVVDRAIARALPAMVKWRDEADADRWFYHFTVLETRRQEAAPMIDAMLGAGRADPPFAAFIRALGSLPTQQREAIILNQGERLNPRYLAVAMDCSGEAAANHLRAGMVGLAHLSGVPLDSLMASFNVAYRQLAIPSINVRPLIRRRLNRFLFPRRLKRWAMIALGAGLAYVVWRVRRIHFG